MDNYGALFGLFSRVFANSNQHIDYMIEGVDIIIEYHQIMGLKIQ